MTLAEMRAKYYALMAEARTALSQANLTAEQRTAIDNKFTEARQLGADIKLAQEAEDAAAEQRQQEQAAEQRARAGRPALPQPGSENSNENRSAEQRDLEHRSALLTYMRTGDQSELRTQQSTVGANGGYSIPTTLLSTLEKALLTYGGVASRLRSLVTASGEPINYPVSNNTSLAATVLAENNPQGDTVLKMGSVPLAVSTLVTGIVRIPFQLIQDSVFSWEEFTRNELGEMYARGIANYLGGITTDANFDPLPSTVSVGATSVAPTSISLADITALYGAVDPAYANEGTWVMNRATQLYLASQRNSYGTPIFPINPSTGQLEVIYGRPIAIDTTLPNMAAGAKSVLFGNLQKYILRTVPGFEIKRLDERYAEFGQVAFLGFFRAGGRYLDAGTHPIQSLQQHA